MIRGTDRVVNAEPLEMIKANMPEFCMLVTVARQMCQPGKESDITSVKSAITQMLETLLSVPVHKSAPTLEQLKGGEQLLYGTELLADQYASELNSHTMKIRQAIDSYKEALDEIHRIREEVINENSESLMQFNELTRLSEDRITFSFNDTVSELLNSLDSMVLPGNSMISDTNSIENLAREDGAEITLPDEDNLMENCADFKSFFDEANGSTISPEVDAEISGVPILSSEPPKEENDQEKEEEGDEEEEEDKEETPPTPPPSPPRTRRTRRSRRNN